MSRHGYHGTTLSQNIKTLLLMLLQTQPWKEVTNFSVVLIAVVPV